MTGRNGRIRPGEARPGTEILAAGALLYRYAGGGIEVALIHRARHDDWTFPKGKVEPGEHVLAAAVREVTEETGIRPVLGRPLATVRYLVEDRPKRVDYWAARVDLPSPTFVPNDEVDTLEWVSPPEAAGRLSYAHDARVLDRLVSPASLGDQAGIDTVPCILLRHASAGHKRGWHGSDLLRPLDERGTADAQTLADLLGCFAPERVISSATERCLGTVRPYAERIGAAIEAEPAFTIKGTAGGDDRSEAARIRMTDLLTHPSPMVICAHRENIPLLLDQARAVLSSPGSSEAGLHGPGSSDVEPRGAVSTANWSPPKPGFWVLHIAGAHLAALEHHDLNGLAAGRRSRPGPGEHPARR